jgi:peptide/nickel transport system substrate-binding protein
VVRAPPSHGLLEEIQRAALYIRMNDLVVQSGIVVPIAQSAKASAMSSRLRGVEHNVYEVDFWNLAYWSRE